MKQRNSFFIRSYEKSKLKDIKLFLNLFRSIRSLHFDYIEQFLGQVLFVGGHFELPYNVTLHTHMLKTHDPCLKEIYLCCYCHWYSPLAAQLSLKGPYLAMRPLVTFRSKSLKTQWLSSGEWGCPVWQPKSSLKSRRSSMQIQFLL